MPLNFPTTAGSLGSGIGATVLGDGDAWVERLVPIDELRPGGMTFCSKRKFSRFLEKAQGGVVVTTQELAEENLPLTFLVVDSPQQAFAEVARKISRQKRDQNNVVQISEKALVHPSAKIAEGVSVGPFATVEKDVVIGRNTIVGAYSYVGSGTTLGSDCELHPRVTVLHEITIGDRVKIFPGAVIGADGFGFLPKRSEIGFEEMPQLGTVVIGNDVCIGANATIDRATLGKTEIGNGTKMDDHVHIAHNCKVGKHCLLAAAAAISGSVVLEDEVMLGGQVGLGEHIVVGKRARIGAQGGTTTNVKGNETYWLTPVVPVKESMQIVRYSRRLPELNARVKRLEEKIMDGEA